MKHTYWRQPPPKQLCNTSWSILCMPYLCFEADNSVECVSRLLCGVEVWKVTGGGLLFVFVEQFLHVVNCPIPLGVWRGRWRGWGGPWGVHSLEVKGEQKWTWLVSYLVTNCPASTKQSTVTCEAKQAVKYFVHHNFSDIFINSLRFQIAMNHNAPKPAPAKLIPD